MTISDHDVDADDHDVDADDNDDYDYDQDEDEDLPQLPDMQELEWRAKTTWKG